MFWHFKVERPRSFAGTVHGLKRQQWSNLGFHDDNGDYHYHNNHYNHDHHNHSEQGDHDDNGNQNDHNYHI